MRVDRRRVLQPVDLRLDPLGDLRVAVSARDGGDAGQQVEVAAACLVEQILHVPVDDGEAARDRA